MPVPVIIGITSQSPGSQSIPVMLYPFAQLPSALTGICHLAKVALQDTRPSLPGKSQSVIDNSLWSKHSASVSGRQRCQNPVDTALEVSLADAETL